MKPFPIDLSSAQLLPPVEFNHSPETITDTVTVPLSISTPISTDPTLDPISHEPEFLLTDEDGTPPNSLIGLSNATLRNQAKSLYFHTPSSLTEIAETLDVPLYELKNYVYGKHHTDWQRDPKCWAYQRQYNPQLSVARYERVEPILVKSSMKSTIQVLIKNLQRMEEAEDVLAVKEIKGLMDIYSQLDKIRRLTDGLATENLGVDRSTWTMREVMEDRRKSNPFMTDCPASCDPLDQSPDIPELIEDVEYKPMEVSR